VHAQIAQRRVAARVVLPNQPEVVLLEAELHALAALVAERGGRDARDAVCGVPSAGTGATSSKSMNCATRLGPPAFIPGPKTDLPLPPNGWRSTIAPVVTRLI